MLSCLAHDFDRQPRRNTAAPSSAPAPRHPTQPLPGLPLPAWPLLGLPLPARPLPGLPRHPAQPLPGPCPACPPLALPLPSALSRTIPHTPCTSGHDHPVAAPPLSASFTVTAKPALPPHHGPLIRPAAPADGAILQRALRQTRQSALRLSGHQWLKWHKMGNLVPIDIRDTGTGTIGPSRFPLRVALFPPEGLLNQSSRLRPASCRSGEPDRSSPCQAAPAGALTAGGSTAPPARTTARPAAPALPAPARTRSRDP